MTTSSKRKILVWVEEGTKIEKNVVHWEVNRIR